MSSLYDNIPAMLKQRRNWVVWNIGGGAPPKTPFNPSSLLIGGSSPAKAGDPATWSSYENAVECVQRGLAAGIGYEFDGKDDIYGVDLDHVIDENRKLTPEAREIILSLNSYTEVSPSGTGIHIFVTAPGADITNHRKKDGFVEIYSEARYFTVTGKAVARPLPIAARTAELQSVHDKYLKPEQRDFPSPAPLTRLSDSEQEDFLRKGLERDKLFSELWEGGRSNGNESSDDIALMNKLAYWCNADPGTMVRAFMSSPYYAQKGDAHKKKCRRSDYLPRTAMASVSSVNSTAEADHQRWLESRKRQRQGAR